MWYDMVYKIYINNIYIYTYPYYDILFVYLLRIYVYVYRQTKLYKNIILQNILCCIRFYLQQYFTVNVYYVSHYSVPERNSGGNVEYKAMSCMYVM